MEKLNPIQFESEVTRIRQECERSIPGFPVGKCKEAVAVLVSQLGCERVETIYTSRGGAPIGHVIANHNILGGVYIDITADQFPGENNPSIIAFSESNPDSRYGVSYSKK